MQETQHETKYSHCGWLTIHTNVRYWFWPKTHALHIDDTEAHRSDVLMSTVQADEIWEHSPSLQDVVVNSCHQVTVNALFKQNRAFFFFTIFIQKCFPAIQFSQILLIYLKAFFMTISSFPSFLFIILWQDLHFCKCPRPIELRILVRQKFRIAIHNFWMGSTILTETLWPKSSHWSYHFGASQQYHWNNCW